MIFTGSEIEGLQLDFSGLKADKVDGRVVFVEKAIKALEVETLRVCDLTFKRIYQFRLSPVRRRNRKREVRDQKVLHRVTKENP